MHPFRKSFHELQVGDTLNIGGARGHAGRHRKLRGAVRRHVLRAHGRGGARAAIRCSAAASRTAISWCPRPPACSSIRRTARCSRTMGSIDLRFLKPVKPGDRIKVRLTCKSKSLRAEKGYGEVAWDTEITNQNGEMVASYDVLTMVSEQPVS